MKDMPDNSVDLMLTDPPYGIGVAKKGKVGGGNLALIKDYGNQTWDGKIPKKEVFVEMLRVSKNQVIFGGNYFVEYLTNSPCWIVWFKNRSDANFADCELAWTSFKSPTKYFRWKWDGMLQEDMKNKEKRAHPTQKPLPLFKWIVSKYSKENDLILDPFLGSGTTAVAAKDLGRRYVGIEISPDYCKIAERRLGNLQPKFDFGEVMKN